MRWADDRVGKPEDDLISGNGCGIALDAELLGYPLHPRPGEVDDAVDLYWRW